MHPYCKETALACFKWPMIICMVSYLCNCSARLLCKKSGLYNFAPANVSDVSNVSSRGSFLLPGALRERGERNKIILSDAAPGVVCSDCRVLSEGDLNRASRGKDVISMAYCTGFPCRTVADERQREVEKLALPEVSANALTMCVPSLVARLAFRSVRRARVHRCRLLMFLGRMWLFNWECH